MRSKPQLASAGDELTRFIHELSDRDPAKREGAAREIFRRGYELVRAATVGWFLDFRLAGCFAMKEPDTPQATVGLAVESGNFDRIQTANGSPGLATVPGDQDAKEFELTFRSGIRLDVLTTRYPGSGGPIERFLQKFGEGIQQVELQVDDVDRATEILCDQFELEPVYPSTHAGANDTRVNFFLVPAAQGKKVLIELVEAPRQDQA